MPALTRSVSTTITAIIFMLASSIAPLAETKTSNATAASKSRASEFKLDNGLQVIVIPDHRSPVVTHMIWYKVGASDEVRGVSGIAHFLEHLMFKSTDTIPVGEFSKIVGRLGGQDNAFTGQDSTAYFQRVAKDRLGKMMEMEADRMVNLRLDEKEVVTERDVILEERRSRIENNPAALLDEQMNAALYLNHPYGVPIIGWYHEMAQLSRQNALDFYQRYYAPNNAILVVSGDVTEDEVRRLAEASYGKIPANPEVGKTRARATEPPQISPRRVELRDARAGNQSFHRYYIAPSYVTAEPGEAEALDLMMKIATNGTTSRLYRSLVVEKKLAASASGDYSGSSLDSGTLSIYAVAANGVELSTVEAAVDEVFESVIKDGVTEKELERAKANFIAQHVYASDNQASLARRYGWNLALGLPLKKIEDWPNAISKVTADDIKKVAAKYLDLRRSVTGYLMPDKKPVASGPTTAPVPASEPASKL